MDPESKSVEAGHSPAMSMYSQLLLASSEHQPEHEEPQELLGHLVACLRRLNARSNHRGGVEPAGDLADNIAYDLALLRVCTWNGIECDARRFGQPLIERQRLEGELAELGLDVAELASPG